MIRIVIVANCQGDLLGSALQHILRPWQSDYAISVLASHDVSTSRLRHEIGTSDIVLEQVSDASPDISGMLSPGVCRIRFPIAQMKWLWPFATQLHPLQGKAVPDYLTHHLPPEFCDSTLNPFVQLGRTDWLERLRTLANLLPDRPVGKAITRRAVAARTVLRTAFSVRAGKGGSADGQSIEDYYRTPPSSRYLDRMFDLCRQKAIADDQASDLTIWPEIERRFRDTRLFWFQTHPTWDLYRGLCGRLARALPIGLSDAVVEAGLDRLGATRPFSNLQAPIHPAIAKHFGLTWCDENTRFEWNAVEGWVTHRTFVERYVRFDPDEAAYLGYWRSINARSSADLSAAQPLLDQALERTPHAPSLHRLSGINLAKQGPGTDRAAIQHLALAAADPDYGDDAGLQAWVGHVRSRMGERDLAVEAYRRSLAVTESARVRQRVARLLAEAGQTEQAIDEWRIADKLDPFDSRTKVALARALVRNGAVAEALDYLSDAIARGDRSRTTLHAFLQTKLQQCGLAGLARDVHGVVLTRDDPEPLIWLCARVHLAAGDKGRAAEAYQILVEVRPSDAAAWIGLADAVINDLDKGLACVDRACQLGSDNPDILARAGQVLAKAGLDEKALPLLERAAELAPNKPWIERSRSVLAARLGVREGRAMLNPPTIGLPTADNGSAQELESGRDRSSIAQPRRAI